MELLTQPDVVTVCVSIEETRRPMAPNKELRQRFFLTWVWTFGKKRHCRLVIKKEQCSKGCWGK